MATANELRDKAREHEAAARELFAQATKIEQQELAAKPIADRLVYAATARCPCGSGLAYDPCYVDKESPFNGPLSNSWDCAEILLGIARTDVKHTDRLPFAFWEIKSENQPSACGATTRPKSEPTAST